MGAAELAARSWDLGLSAIELEGTVKADWSDALVARQRLDLEQCGVEQLKAQSVLAAGD